MNVWLITTGNSDVQVKVADVWNDWYPEIKKELHGIDRKRFQPTRTIDDDGVPYRMPARVLGLAYEKLGEVVKEQLEFPLLKEFGQQLEARQVAIDQIILLVSDQSDVFDEGDRASYHCPYWQDTCLLYPILETYLRTRFPTAQATLLPLKPSTNQSGLDNWNEVLALVRQQIGRLAIEPETIYVSHQAGTPAISSAVQFSSLAKFGDRVKFLVSNEHQPEQSDLIPSSSYLRGIQIEQAKKLLDRYDYAGVEDLIAEYLDCDTKALLEAAIQWNFAEFDVSESDKARSSSFKQHSFANRLKHHPKFVTAVDDHTKSENWWWIAYESAYLGFVRLEQGDTVEAMFHSFRAVEGLLKTWSDKCYPGELVQTKHPRWKENERWNRNLKSHGQDLYCFLTLKKSVDENKDIRQNTTPDIFIFGTQSFGRRNDLFHNLKGLQGKEKVFENWRSPNEPQWRSDPVDKWKMRVLNCLNFISDQPFSSLEEASLMSQVHGKLASAIAQL
jgi:hypothetical protein